MLDRNPKKEDGPKNIKPGGGMIEWTRARRDACLLSDEELKFILSFNEKKYERLISFGLPFFRTTGACESLGEAISRLPGDKWGCEKFLVRCLPKNFSKSGLKLERRKGINLDEISKFVKDLPGGSEKYTIEIREDWSSDYSGTITANGNDRIVIEQKEGEHAQFEEVGIDSIKRAVYCGDIQFEYSENTTDEEKEIMMSAFKYLSPLEREKLARLRIYAEYCYSKKHGFRFYDVTDDKFWTE